MKNMGTILVVEDIDEDFEILRWAFAEVQVTNVLKRCCCSSETLDFLAPHGAAVMPLPACLVLLDLNLPDAHGSETLRQIRRLYSFAELPVIAYSTSSNPKTIRDCYAAGATSYVIKPLGLDRVEWFVKNFLRLVAAKCRNVATLEDCFLLLLVIVEPGVPTRGIRALDVDADCKKLTRQDVQQLFKAADALIMTEDRSNAVPRRNRAILAVLYYTGLRVSELVALRRDQYRKSYLVNVARKGKARSKELYLVAEFRRQLDLYIETEPQRDDPVLRRIAQGPASIRRRPSRSTRIATAPCATRLGPSTATRPNLTPRPPSP